MKSAIEFIVAAYIETDQMSALQDLKMHRENMLLSIRDRADFNFGVLLSQLEDDLREIEDGIRRLRAATDVRSVAE